MVARFAVLTGSCFVQLAAPFSPTRHSNRTAKPRVSPTDSFTSFRRTIDRRVLTRLVYTIAMELSLGGIKEMLLGIQLSLLGYVFESFRLAPE